MTITDNTCRSFDDELIKYGDTKTELNLTWDDVAHFLNSTYHLNYSESFYRKRYVSLTRARYADDSVNDNVYTKDVIDTDNSTNEEYYNILREIKKERAKLSDERIQNNAYIRKLSREETLKDIAREAVEKLKICSPIIEPFDILEYRGEKEGVLVISDWHYGLVCNSTWNTYDPDIALKRITDLQNKVSSYILEHNICKLTIVNLSDLICGRIHLPLRIESRFDVITQTMKISEILAEFINNLSALVNISYYDCEDNHSRVEPNKSDSLHLENFTRIIKWFVAERLRDNARVTINTENEYSEDIVTFESNGFRFAAVHGDKDKISSIVENITLMTHESFDVILTAHMHHFAADEVNETVILQNGTLMGTDGYAQSLRKSSKPSQLFIVTTKDNPTESIHRILL